MGKDKIYFLKDQPKDPAGWIQGLNKSGYAGMARKTGMIVDRREFPDAVPVEENRIFGVIKPKELPQPKENEYQCAACQEVFQKSWTDGEAWEEYQRIFPDEEAKEDEVIVFCDHCYNLLMEIVDVLETKIEAAIKKYRN